MSSCRRRIGRVRVSTTYRTAPAPDLVYNEDAGSSFMQRNRPAAAAPALR